MSQVTLAIRSRAVCAELVVTDMGQFKGEAYPVRLDHASYTVPQPSPIATPEEQAAETGQRVTARRKEWLDRGAA